MRVELIPLGTNGYIPSFGRHTMSFLVTTAKTALLLDAGTGVARLLEPNIREALAPYDRLDIVLTHYHLDHLIGLSYLPGVWSKPVRIFAPDKPYVDTEPDQAIGSLLRPPFFSLALDHFPMEIELRPYGKESLEVGDLSLRCRRQDHPGGSVGIRIEDDLAYITDTVVDNQSKRFISGVELLLHEIWLTDEEARANPGGSDGHSSAGQVISLAADAGVRRLLPVHHHPKRTNQDLERLIHSLETGTAEVVRVQEGVRISTRQGGLQPWQA